MPTKEAQEGCPEVLFKYGALDESVKDQTAVGRMLHAPFSISRRGEGEFVISSPDLCLGSDLCPDQRQEAQWNL